MKLSSRLKRIIIIILSLLSCIDFFGMGVYIMSGLGAICVLLFPNVFIRCVSTRCFWRFFLLCFFSTILYCFQSWSFNRTFIASILLMPLSMYVVGYCLIESQFNTRTFLISTMQIFAIFTSAYGFITALNKGDLSAYSNYSDAYINNLMRTSYNIWNHNVIAGTVLSPMFVLSISVSVYSLLCLRGVKRITLAIFTMLGIAGSLLLGSRANFVILLFCIVVALICILSNLNRKQKILKRAILLLFLIIICLVLNIGGILDKILNSTLFYRLNVIDSSNNSSLFSADGRWDIIWNYLVQLLNHPLGGISIDTGHSAHNTILQFGAFGGFVGLFLALWFYIPFWWHIIRTSWCDRNEVKLLFLPFVISVILLFMVESISISNSTIYSLFIMILVMIRQHYIREKYNVENKKDVC